mmetsp:Transcript_44452/g.140268  ORF Transcript_44452/g.140268 Transcript_44452/m.140268 type:complete len:195 (-) Transcript_44452:50-634(-)
MNSILITDGNEKVVEGLKESLKTNQGPEHSTVFCCKEIGIRQLIWSEKLSSLQVPRAGTFDFVIGADCLFFRDYHKALVHTLDVLLSSNGQALLWAPKRGGTLEEFCALAQEKFEVQQEQVYDDEVWSKHLKALNSNQDQGGKGLALQYDESIHYPLKIVLKKKRKSITPPSWAMGHRGGSGCPCCKGRKMPMF